MLLEFGVAGSWSFKPYKKGGYAYVDTPYTYYHFFPDETPHRDVSTIIKSILNLFLHIVEIVIKQL